MKVLPKALSRKGSKLHWGKAAALSLLALSACSPLRLFNTFVPKDGGSRVVLRAVAFGSDPRQKLDIYAPTAPSARPWPVIVFIYGGSWSSGFREGYSFVGRALAARGFLVAIPDYRLVPQVQYPAFLQDNAAAVHWVIAHAAEYHGDPRKLVLAGHSAGAYDAAMLTYDPRWLGADRSAVRAMIGLAGPYDFLPSKLPVVIAAFGPAPDPASSQPMEHVRPGAAPAFLASGDNDKTVDPKNSDTLAARLTAVGIPVERERYAGIDHVGIVASISEPFRRKAPVLEDMMAFARKYTQ